MDYLYSFILDGSDLLDGPSGPLGALYVIIPSIEFDH